MTVSKRLCPSCSAPLEYGADECAYCGHSFKQVIKKTSGNFRSCPECSTRMHTIKADKDKQIDIEKCPSCNGLYFDLNELEKLVGLMKKAPITSVLNVDSAEVTIEQQKQPDCKCPICGEKMDRAEFKGDSGVTYDYCIQHGIYLNKGELTRIIAWKKNKENADKNIFLVWIDKFSAYLAKGISYDDRTGDRSSRFFRSRAEDYAESAAESFVNWLI